MRLAESLGFVVVLCAMLAGSASAEDLPADSDVERIAVAPDTEKLAYAQATLSDLRAVVADLQRADQDVRKDLPDGIPCVTNNLAAARALLQTTEGTVAALQAAIAEGASQRTELLARSVAIARSSGRKLQSEAERCAYGDGSADGKARMKILGQPTDDDEGAQAEDDDSEQSYGFDPPNASPF